MKTLFIILIILNLSIIKSGDCDPWDSQYFCGEPGTDGYDYLEELDANAFQTPPRNDIYGRYMETFQDMHYLVGYARTEYSADRKSATVIFETKVNPILGIINQDYKINYAIPCSGNSIFAQIEELLYQEYPSAFTPFFPGVVEVKHIVSFIYDGKMTYLYPIRICSLFRQFLIDSIQFRYYEIDYCFCHYTILLKSSKIDNIAILYQVYLIFISKNTVTY